MIIKNNLFIENIEKINRIEKERIYCKHYYYHLFDTARIAYIKALEENINIPKYIIYSAAVLHDIGRAEQYINNIPHEKAGAQIAKKILTECKFEKEDISLIINSIVSHNLNDNYQNKDILSKLIYEADKLSRLCFICSSENSCYWTKEKKNMQIKY